MIKKVEGIIISTVNYKESIKIINILTKEQGIIGVFARGSRNLKSKLSSVTSPLCYGTFHLSARDEKMPNLIEVDLLNTFKQIRKDFIKSNYSLFLLELAGQVYKHSNKNNTYDLLIDGLLKINEGYDPQVITNIVELKYLEYLGIKPVVDKCVTCSSPENIITISSYKGGYLCQNCVGTEYIYHLKTLKLIRMFYYINLSKITKVEISDIIKKELNQFIDDCYERYSGLYLKSKTFLEEFCQHDEKSKSEQPISF